MSVVRTKHRRKARILLYLIMAALVVLIVYSLQGQAGTSTAGKVIEAGLIESGTRPALYFDLRNTGKDYANYTYIVAYNTTSAETKIDKSSISVPPGQTFSYSISLMRPSDGVAVLNVRIYRGSSGALLHNQTWVIKPDNR